MRTKLHDPFNTRQAQFYAASFNAVCDKLGMGRAVAERLRDVRRKAGYRTGSDAARAFGWTVGTYLSHENGNRGVDSETAERYAKAFGVTPAQILFEETAEKAPKAAAGRARASEPPPLDESRLAELIQSVLVAYGDLPAGEAQELAKSVIQRARRPRGGRGDGPEGAQPPDTPASPEPGPGPKGRQ